MKPSNRHVLETVRHQAERRMLNRPCCLRHMPASLPSDESQQQQQQQRAASGTRAVYDTPALFHSALSYCIGLSRRGVLIA